MDNLIQIPLPLSQQLAYLIRNEITSGEIKSGERLDVKSICDRFGISETPVKEAFKILQSEGLLRIKPRSGTYVSDYAKSGIQSLSYIRSALEGVAVNLATIRSSDEELESLEHVLDKSDEAIQSNDLSALVMMNTSFHRTIRELAKSDYLYNLIEQMIAFDLSIRNKALNTLENRIKGSYEHRAIVNQMKKRNSEEAERLMISHIRKTAEQIE